MKLEANQISAICEHLLNKLPDLLDFFDIEYRLYGDRYSFACPVHEGDNLEGCSIFIDGKVNWVCWTNNCQEKYSKNLIGFVTAILEQRKSEKISFHDAVNFCVDFLKCELVDPIPQNLDLSKYLKALEIFSAKTEIEPLKISRELVQASLQIPSPYYLKRGFSPEILIKFDIGDCLRENKAMYRRAVVPFYNTEMAYLGCSGRTIDDRIKPKWKNDQGFRKSETLYGIHIAKKSIMESGTAHVLEGPGDVWRMNEAGFENSVGISGANLSDSQLLELECSGCMNLVILTDSDEAGNAAANQIMKKCGRRFNYKRPEFKTKDIGEMNIENLKILLENY